MHTFSNIIYVKMLIKSFISIFLLLSINTFADSKNTWNTVSNVLGYGMPLIALGYSIDQEDEKGFIQIGESLITAIGTSQVLKSAFPKDRPDGSGNDSFPSDHAAVMFSTARYMTKRYDANLYTWYLAAGLTGIARVQADKHSWTDVLAGGAIGYLSSEIWVDRKDRQLAIFPQPGGLVLSFKQQF
jgi:hypothetical protein